MKQGQPSQTAVRIAANLFAAAREPTLRTLLLHPDEPYPAWFLREFSPTALRLWSWGPTRRWLYRTYEGRTPGASLYLLLRKRWVEERVREFLSAGVEQLLVLGGGLDPLTLRLAAEFPDVRFYELDHPATQEIKEAALARHEALPDNLFLTPLDLSTESLDACLPRLESYSREARTLFLVEGVLMYLSPDEARRALQTMADFSAPGSPLIATLLDRRAAEDPETTTGRMAAVLEQMGEPFRFSVYRKNVPDTLARSGFEVQRQADHEELRKLYLKPSDDRVVVDGELLVVAQSLDGRARRRGSPEARIRPGRGAGGEGKSAAGSQ